MILGTEYSVLNAYSCRAVHEPRGSLEDYRPATQGIMHGALFWMIIYPGRVILFMRLFSPWGQPDGIDHRVTRPRTAARASVSPEVCHSGEGKGRRTVCLLNPAEIAAAPC